MTNIFEVLLSVVMPEYIGLRWFFVKKRGAPVFFCSKCLVAQSRTLVDASSQVACIRYFYSIFFVTHVVALAALIESKQ